MLPIVDAVVATAAVIAGSVGLYYGWGRDHEGYVLPAGAALVGGAIEFGSARSGFGWAETCRNRGSSGVAAK